MRRWKDGWDSIVSLWCSSVRWPWPQKPWVLAVQQNVLISGCVCMSESALRARRKDKTFKTYPAEQERITFFLSFFFPPVFHLMLLQWSLFSFFSFLPWFNTKAQCFRIFALYVVFFLLSFWSSWWSPVPPLLPFERWNSHGKDLVQLLVSLLFLVLSKQMESKHL